MEQRLLSPVRPRPHEHSRPRFHTPMEALPFGASKLSVCQAVRNRFGADVDSRTTSSCSIAFVSGRRIDLEQQMDCALGEIFDRLANRRQRRPHHLRHRRVVEAGHRHRRRDLEAGAMQAPASRPPPCRRWRKQAPLPSRLAKQPLRRFDARMECEIAGRGPWLLIDPGLARARRGSRRSEAPADRCSGGPLTKPEPAMAKRRRDAAPIVRPAARSSMPTAGTIERARSPAEMATILTPARCAQATQLEIVRQAAAKRRSRQGARARGSRRAGARDPPLPDRWRG